MSINNSAEDDMRRMQALDLARESGKGDLTGLERDRELMRQNTILRDLSDRDAWETIKEFEKAARGDDRR